jgi:gluconolactonase
MPGKVSLYLRDERYAVLVIMATLVALAAQPLPLRADGLRVIGTVERLDPAVDALVPADAKMEIVIEGLNWCEGPLWIPAGGGFVICSDIPANTIHRWDTRSGPSVYLTPSGYTGDKPRGGESGSNALALDREGRLLLCQHGDRRMARMGAPLTSPAPKFITLADRYDGKRFNSPNDCAVHSTGAIYFTDPPYGLENYTDDPAQQIPGKELDFQGVYRISPDGQLTLLTKGLERPNGIAFSPDEKTLYVSNSHRPRPIWMAFPVKEDGSLGEGRVFFDATDRVAANLPGMPDGMKIDQHGNLFAAGPGGILILSPEGKHLGTLATGDRTANCAFGEDGSTLFIACNHNLLRIRLSTKGQRF